MQKKRLFWQLYPSYVCLALASLIAIVLLACLSFRSFYYKEAQDDLESRAILISDQVRALLEINRPKQIHRLAQELGSKSNTHFTILLPNGKVIGDSTKKPTEMQNLADRIEIYDAINKDRGMAIRYDHNIKKEMMYVARSLIVDNKRISIIRAAIPLTAVKEALWVIYLQVFIGSLGMLFAVALISWWLAQRVSKPLEEMKAQAKNIAHGIFTKRILSGPSDSIELQQLGNAMNEIAIELDERIKTILQQRNEQKAIFSSMSEGVIAIDQKEKIKFLNVAAAEIFNLSSTDCKNKNLQEVIRDPQIHEIVRNSLKEQTKARFEIMLSGENEKCIDIHTSPLKSPEREVVGTVLVFGDITRLKELENQRKDFVANVSHELRTPLTSIQGYVELLMNSAADDTENRQKFLKVIHKHSNRLSTIIEDLLALSKLETDVDKEQIELRIEKIRPSLVAAIELCAVVAKKRNVAIEIDCERKIQTKINPPLLEQAVVNLLDNAIKYSKENSKVLVSVTKKVEEIHISIKDSGIGIPKENLARLFERFYRVDKARSRDIGGTGLGLSIVKHVVIVHRGNVNVESQFGQGSTFTIQLPC